MFGGREMSFNICRGTIGSLAKFTAKRTASSRLISLAPRASLPEINRMPVAELFPLALDERFFALVKRVSGKRTVLALLATLIPIPKNR